MMSYTNYKYIHLRETWRQISVKSRNRFKHGCRKELQWASCTVLHTRSFPVKIPSKGTHIRRSETLLQEARSSVNSKRELRQNHTILWSKRDQLIWHSKSIKIFLQISDLQLNANQNQTAVRKIRIKYLWGCVYVFLPVAAAFTSPAAEYFKW